MAITDVGKLLVILGVVIVIVGVLFVIGNPLRLGQLPGDVSGSRGSFSFAFPIVTCIAISIVLTVVLNIILRLRQ